MKTIELNVTGLHCVRCEAGVAKAIETVEGVEKAVADRTHDRVLVRLSDDNTDVAAIKAAVEADPDKDWKMVGVVE